MGDAERDYQISVPVQPGNSGGPLFNLNGEVIGVVATQMRGMQNVNHAVKKAELEAFLREKAVTPEGPLRAAGRASIPELIKRVQQSVVMVVIE